MPRLNCWQAAASLMSVVTQESVLVVEVPAGLRPQYFVFLISDTLKRWSGKLKNAKSIGCYNMTLNVWEGNDPACSFYKNMGMKVQKTGMEVILE